LHIVERIQFNLLECRTRVEPKGHAVTNAAYYREQAASCLAAARACPRPHIARMFENLGRGFEQLARRMGSPAAAPPDAGNPPPASG
jgi:hypothetical protein